MKTVYLVRHAESTANAIDGFSDPALLIPLTERGRLQAIEIGKKLLVQGIAPDAIITTKLIRAWMTAELIARELGFPVGRIEADQRLVEINSGRFDAMAFTAENRHKRNEQYLLPSNAYGVDRISDIVGRCESFKADLEKRPEATILIVGHGFSGRALRRLFAGVERTVPLPQLDNAELMQLYPYVELTGEGERQL